jgi:hypothetical protein
MAVVGILVVSVASVPAPIYRIARTLPDLFWDAMRHSVAVFPES